MTVIGMQPVRRHGSCPSTTSGRTSRMTCTTAARSCRVGRRARRRRSAGNARSCAPRAAAASCCSSSRWVIERGEVGVGVPCALGAVGADAQVHLGAGGRPLGERRAAAELDVVGVGADREHACRPGEIDRERHGFPLWPFGPCRRATARARRTALAPDADHGVGDSSAARSAGVSTSKPRLSSWTMRTSRPAATRPRRGGGRTNRVRTRTRSRRRSGSRSTGVPSSRWSGTITATGAPPSSATPSRRRGERQVGVHDDDARQALCAHPIASRGCGARRASPGRRLARARAASPTSRPRRRSRR